MRDKTKSNEWIFSVGDLNVTSGRKIPKIDKTKVDIIKGYLEHHFTGIMMHECQDRLYTGRIRGSRTSKTKRSVKNINYWLLRMVDGCGRQLSVNMTKTGIDVYGNMCNNYTLDFWDYEFSTYCHLNGRAYLQVMSEIRSYLIVSRLKRWLVNKFPRLMNPLNNRYKTTFDVIIRFWVDQWHYFDILCYQIKVTDNIVIPYNESSYAKRRETISRKEAFSARKSLSGL